MYVSLSCAHVCLVFLLKWLWCKSKTQVLLRCKKTSVRPMAQHRPKKSFFGCPTLESGKPTCDYGCTRDWPMCHMFQDNKCHAQHFPEYCTKGWHVRQNERRAPDYYTEPPEKRRRREHAAPTKTFRTEQEQSNKQNMRLIRLGWFESQLPTRDELEKAYTFHQKEWRNSSHSSEDIELQLKKLKSAFTNISKELHDRAPSPSTDDDEVRTPR